MALPDSTIVSVNYVAILPDGSERVLAIRIGRPCRRADRLWACTVDMTGLHDRSSDLMGIDALQALGVATSFVRSLLEHFVSIGGRIMFATTSPSDREEIPIASLFGATSVEDEEPA